MRKVGLTICLLIVFTLSMTACSNDSSPDESEAKPTTTPAATSVPTLSPILINLQRDYEQISAAQAAILQIWEDLAANKQVQCGADLTTINPEDMTQRDEASNDSAYATLNDLLRQAAIDTAQAVDLWQAECLQPRTVIPPDVIDQGRMMARSAGDALREAQPLFGPIQGN
ncbi:MAG: hypothetical protein JXA10_05095 [Anaerolineae bacterium]|nr:hypothetical protein [Anaerolineae bacterium]